MQRSVQTKVGLLPRTFEPHDGISDEGLMKNLHLRESEVLSSPTSNLNCGIPDIDHRCREHLDGNSNLRCRRRNSRG